MAKGLPPDMRSPAPGRGGPSRLRPAAAAVLAAVVWLMQPTPSAAKIHPLQLPGIDRFPPASSLYYLNPVNGISMAESPLLANLGEVEIRGVEVATLDARTLLSRLFHRLPGGYLPSTGSFKLAFYLHPELIGKLV